MHKYIKNANGDPGSPINHAIDGLYFHIWVDANGKPFPRSPYGDIRVVLPLKRMITPEVHNVYFSDFYCHDIFHKITLVVTERGSPEDKFCEKHLLSLGLDPFRNPFFFFNPVTDMFYCSLKLKVEIFYCMDIDLTCAFLQTQGCFHYETETTGAIDNYKFMPPGKPKNKTCKICNIY